VIISKRKKRCKRLYTTDCDVETEARNWKQVGEFHGRGGKEAVKEASSDQKEAKGRKRSA